MKRYWKTNAKWKKKSKRKENGRDVAFEGYVLCVVSSRLQFQNKLHAASREATTRVAAVTCGTVLFRTWRTRCWIKWWVCATIARYMNGVFHRPSVRSSAFQMHTIWFACLTKRYVVISLDKSQCAIWYAFGRLFSFCLSMFVIEVERMQTSMTDGRMLGLEFACNTHDIYGIQK